MSLALFPSAPVPATWPLRASDQVYADDLNTQLSTAVKYLARPPVFYAQQQQSASVVSSTNEDLTMDTPIIDSYGGQSNDANLAQYIIPPGCGGIWLVVGVVPFQSGNATSNFQAKFDANGTLIPGSYFGSQVSATVAPMICDLVDLPAGQYIALTAWQNTGGTVGTLATYPRFPYLYHTWVSNTTGTAGLTAPNQATWAALEECTSANFNSQIYDAVSFLAYPPYMRAVQTSATTMANGTSTVVTNLSTSPATLWDNYSSFASNTWTCQVAGTYLVGAQVAMNNSSAASYVCQVKATISSYTNTFNLASAYGQGNTGIAGLRTFRFSVGDTVQLAGQQNSGGNLSTTGDNNTRLFTLWQSK